MEKRIYAMGFYESSDIEMITDYKRIKKSVLEGLIDEETYNELFKMLCNAIRKTYDINNLISIVEAEIKDTGMDVLIINVYPVVAGVSDVYYQGFDKETKRFYMYN